MSVARVTGRKAVLFLLTMLVGLAVSLVPAPAIAGTLEGVYHQPTGFDELYGSQPTERAPRDPMAGDSVTIKATTWPVSPGQSVWVTWTKNGVNQTPVGAQWDYNRACCTNRRVCGAVWLLARENPL